MKRISLGTLHVFFFRFFFFSSLALNRKKQQACSSRTLKRPLHWFLTNMIAETYQQLYTFITINSNYSV